MRVQTGPHPSASLPSGPPVPRVPLDPSPSLTTFLLCVQYKAGDFSVFPSVLMQTRTPLKVMSGLPSVSVKASIVTG